MNHKKFLFYKGLAITGFLIPMLVLFCCEPSYFIRHKAFSVGVGGVTAGVVICIVLKRKLAEFVGKNPILFAMLIFSIIVTFLRNSLQLLPLIGWCSVVGILISGVFDRVADVYYAVAYKQISDKIRVKNVAPPIPDKEAFKIAFGLTVEQSFLDILEQNAPKKTEK